MVVLYASHHGTTGKVAVMLSDQAESDGFCFAFPPLWKILRLASGQTPLKRSESGPCGVLCFPKSREQIKIFR